MKGRLRSLSEQVPHSLTNTSRDAAVGLPSPGSQKKLSHLGQMETLPAIWIGTEKGGQADRRVQRRIVEFSSSNFIEIVFCNQLFISEL